MFVIAGGSGGPREHTAVNNDKCQPSFVITHVSSWIGKHLCVCVCGGRGGEGKEGCLYL